MYLLNVDFFDSLYYAFDILSLWMALLSSAVEREPFSLTLVVVLVVVEALSRCMQKPSFSLAESAIALRPYLKRRRSKNGDDAMALMR